MTESAIFAAGCFWCIQKDLNQIEGITETVVGYTGGESADPSYEEVCSGASGHVEAIEVQFDPSKISYKQLLDLYWCNVDPTRNDGQFCDSGSQYRPIIFYQDEEQKALAEESKEELIQKRPDLTILVEILPARTFYPAEEYHQKYYEKNPIRYKFYRFNCGRDKRLKEIWNRPQG